MAENTKGRLFLKESDFVEVEGPDGQELPSVPKHWGKDQLAPGAKKVGRASKSSGSSSSTSGSSTQPTDPNAEPAGNASTEAWVKYATDVKGAKPEDLVDDKGEPLTRDALKAKYGTATGS